MAYFPHSNPTTMNNSESWSPSKFSIKSQELRVSKEPNRTSASSWLMADLIAKGYTRLIKKYCKGDLLDLGCGEAPMYGLYKNYTNTTTCADWENTFHKNKYLDHTIDLTKPISLESNRFDTIILSDVLEHIPTPNLLISEVSRLLKQDGILLLNVPFYYRLHEMPYDYFRYTKFGLEHLAKEANLNIVELTEIGGSPEILTDIISKHIGRTFLIGNALSKTLYYICTLFIKTKIGNMISKKTGIVFPFGYFLVAKKSASLEKQTKVGI